MAGFTPYFNTLVKDPITKQYLITRAQERQNGYNWLKTYGGFSSDENNKYKIPVTLYQASKPDDPGSSISVYMAHSYNIIFGGNEQGSISFPYLSGSLTAPKITLHYYLNNEHKKVVLGNISSQTINQLSWYSSMDDDVPYLSEASLYTLDELQDQLLMGNDTLGNAPGAIYFKHVFTDHYNLDSTCYITIENAYSYIATSDIGGIISQIHRWNNELTLNPTSNIGTENIPLYAQSTVGGNNYGSLRTYLKELENDNGPHKYDAIPAGMLAEGKFQLIVTDDSNKLYPGSHKLVSFRNVTVGTETTSTNYYYGKPDIEIQNDPEDQDNYNNVNYTQDLMSDDINFLLIPRSATKAGSGTDINYWYMYGLFIKTATVEGGYIKITIDSIAKYTLTVDFDILLL